MKFSLTETTLAIALLFAPVQETRASLIAPEMFQANDDGIIEMDLHIGQKTNMEMYDWPALLQSLHEESIDEAQNIHSKKMTDKVKGIKAINNAKYIESKLTTFFNI